MISSIGSGNGYVDWKKGILELSLNRFAVNEGKNQMNYVLQIIY